MTMTRIMRNSSRAPLSVRSLTREKGLIGVCFGCCLLIAFYEYRFPLYWPDLVIHNEEPTAPHNEFKPVRIKDVEIKSTSTNKHLHTTTTTTSIRDLEKLSMKKKQSIDNIEALVKKKGFIVFTGTRYSSIDDVRFRTCLDLIASCLESDTPLVIVDSSPDEQVVKTLQSSGALVYRQVAEGRKGTSLREGAVIASQLPGVDPNQTYLCFQEPEKVDMVRHWPRVVAVQKNVLLPYRSLKLFEETYASEQFHSELYGNLYLDAAAKEGLGKINKELLPLIDKKIVDEMKRYNHNIPRVDWHFGPLAIQAKHINLWTEYKQGDSYDSQLVPLVHAMRKGLSYSSVHVDYEASMDMKQQEEGNMVFIEKRLWQLNEVEPRVVKAWMEDFYI